MAERTFKIHRFNPEKDEKPYFQEYRFEVESGWSILDSLNHIKWNIDSSLNFRRSCRSGICGSCAMRVNGENALACETQVKNVKGSKIKIEPLPGLAVMRDLVVDMEPFFEGLKKVMPYFVTKDSPPDKEWLQSPEDRKKLDEPIKCILCACCTASCPSFWFDDKYVGPAALVKSYRFVFDSRDQAREERLDIVNDREGLWRCHTIFNCVEACPKDINCTQAIAELKKATVFSTV
ncbi:MAG: succinate dehydrogenase iron-sulfur subunit [Chloroflexi bacterium]|nr:succinate dehydrogenase iron-sulfur subunit [Chloroflexota bacterium]